MKAKILIASLLVLIAGCGANGRSVVVATVESNVSEPHQLGVRHVDFPGQDGRRSIAAVAEVQNWPTDPALLEQACFAFSECRTTANGLGV